MVKKTASFSFGEYLVEPSEYRVTRSGKRVILRPKSFEVLCHLVKHRDRLVTKDDLLDAVWPNTYVTNTALRQSIWEIRQALDSQGEKNSFIKTIPKAGYQFVGDVKQIPAETIETRPSRQAEAPYPALPQSSRVPQLEIAGAFFNPVRTFLPSAYLADPCQSS
jgi:DNA-binding winged helix-turn-helix (wHTH) protein